jgi:hypothetical protein
MDEADLAGRGPAVAAGFHGDGREGELVEGEMLEHGGEAGRQRVGASAA